MPAGILLRRRRGGAEGRRSRLELKRSQLELKVTEFGVTWTSKMLKTDPILRILSLFGYWAIIVWHFEAPGTWTSKASKT